MFAVKQPQEVTKVVSRVKKKKTKKNKKNVETFTTCNKFPYISATKLFDTQIYFGP